MRKKKKKYALSGYKKHSHSGGRALRGGKTYFKGGGGIEGGGGEG